MGHLEVGLLNLTERLLAVNEGDKQRDLRSIEDSRLEIPEWLHEVRACEVADIIPTTAGLKSALGSFSSFISFKAAIELLEVRWEQRVGVHGWDHSDLASAVEWVIKAKNSQPNLRSIKDSRLEIPESLHEVTASQVAEVIPTTPGLRSALASVSSVASFKTVVELLEARWEDRVGVHGWDRNDLASAVEWVIRAKDSAVSEFLDEQLNARIVAIIARAAGIDGSLVREVFENFRRMVQTPLLKATCYWRMRLGVIERHVRATLAVLERLAEGQPVSLIDEIAVFFDGLSHRDRTLVVRYLGLDGKPVETLEALGAQAGITRERVRQIVQRFVDGNSPMRPPLPICEATLEVLKNTEGPLTLSRWSERLPDLLRPDSPDVLIVLRILERWGWLPENTWIRADGLMLALPGRGQEEVGQQFVRRFMPALRNAMTIGAASVSQLAVALEQDRTQVASVLRSTDRWEQVNDDWYVFKDCAGRLLPRVVAKMLAVLGPLSVDQIRGGLRRYRGTRYRQRLPVPPVPILRAILKAAGVRFSDAGDVVESTPDAGSDPLSGGESVLVQALRNNTVLTRHELVGAIRAQGRSEALGQYLLTSSPFITRVSYGIYALRGRRVTHADIQIAERRLSEQSSTSLIDQRFEVDGSIRVLYRLPPDRDLVTFYVRPGMIPEGVWTLVESRSRQTVLVRPTYVTGLQELARRLKRSGAAEIEVRFDVARGEIRVSALTRENP